MAAYRTILADPPWSYGDKLTMSLISRSADDHYQTMSIPEICALYDRETQELAGHHVETDAFLWLWTTNPFLLDGSAAAVCHAWRFVPKQLITWVKGRIVVDDVASVANAMFAESKYPHATYGKVLDLFKRLLKTKLILRTGMGHYTRGATEHLILATRGRPKVFVLDHGVANTFLAEEDTVFLASAGVHSKKPEESYKLIERVCPGPYLELFARKPRENWTVWGDESKGGMNEGS
jgi:N6-adenosine-specific RNA methylase IME4